MPMMRSGSWMIFLFLAAWSIGQAQEAVHLQRLSGEPVRGFFAGILETGEVQVRVERELVKVPLGEVIALLFAEGPPRPQTAPFACRLANGDVLYGSIEQGTFDDLTLQTYAGGSIRLLLDAVAELSALEHQALMHSDTASDREEGADELLLAAGTRLDRTSGELLRFDKAGVHFKPKSGTERHFEFGKDRVASVRLAAGVSLEPRTGIAAIVRFRDGSRLSGTLTGDGASLVLLRTEAGPEIPLDLRTLVSMEIRNSTFRFLSELSPIEHEEEPFFFGGSKQGLLRDRGLEPKKPVALGDRTFRRGLLIAARSRLSFDLGGKARSFTAELGCDPGTRERGVPGSVRVRVLLDGKEVFQSALLIAGDAPVPLAISCEGANRMTIEVEFAESGPTGSIAVFGDPILRLA